MTFKNIIETLQKNGSKQYKKIYENHGTTGLIFGVKTPIILDLAKKVQKVKDNLMLCKELYESKYYEARIIAFLSIDPNDLSDEEFLSWTMCDQSSSLTENYVVEMAIKHDNAHQYTMDFMNSNNPVLESLAYNLYAKAIKKGLFEQNIVELNKIIAHIENRLQISSNRVKYTMNNFLIAVACYVKKLRKNVYETHRVIGKFTVDMGKTACKIPDVIKFTKKYIAKHEKK